MYQIAQFMTNLFGLKSIGFSLFFSCFTNLSAQNEHAFKIYTAKGKSISYKKMQNLNLALVFIRLSEVLFNGKITGLGALRLHD